MVDSEDPFIGRDPGGKALARLSQGHQSQSLSELSVPNLNSVLPLDLRAPSFVPKAYVGVYHPPGSTASSLSTELHITYLR